MRTSWGCSVERIGEREGSTHRDPQRDDYEALVESAARCPDCGSSDTEDNGEREGSRFCALSRRDCGTCWEPTRDGLEIAED